MITLLLFLISASISILVLSFSIYFLLTMLEDRKLKESTYDDTIDSYFTFKEQYANDPLLQRMNKAFDQTKALVSQHALDDETKTLLTYTMRKDLLYLRDLYERYPHFQKIESLLMVIEEKIQAIEDELMDTYSDQLDVLQTTYQEKYTYIRREPQ